MDLINSELKLKKVLIVEPFFGGSHKQLIDQLIASIRDYTFVYLTPKKWHWRARCSALILSQQIPQLTDEAVLFCTSVVNLAELIGLRADLQNLRKIIYFHENQLIYPVQTIKKRDVQYQYNQIVSCLAADVVIFNSHFNMDSFLVNIEKIIKLLPDYKPQNIKEHIQPKCLVLYFPISYPLIDKKERPSILHIIWPHRWEHDKNPKEFFNVLFKLKNEGKNFLVSILGECYSEVPEIFPKAKEFLEDEIINYGYLESRKDYVETLSTGHVVVSTSNHEFFGVAMLEATHLGCFPLVPDRLVYPEIYPKECLYTDEDDLHIKLSALSDNPQVAVQMRNKMGIDLNKYSDKELLPRYLNLFK